MNSPVAATDALIARLGEELQPVERLRPAAARAALWLLAVGTIAALVIRYRFDAPAFRLRMALTRNVVEAVAIGLTAITATFSAFELSVPGRAHRWAWLPVLPLLVWLGASGLGCLHNGLSLKGPEGFIGESGHCFRTILAASVPLTLGLFWLLRRARPIDPLPVAALGTLATAATAAFLLEFVHNFDVTVIDLALHLSAVGLVVLVGTALRRPLLAAR